MSEIAQVKNLRIGTIFRKIKGDVLFMLTSNLAFKNLAERKLAWYPQPGGGFKPEPSIFPVPVDVNSLFFSHRAWSQRNLWLRTQPAVSLHKGRFEFCSPDREVVVMGTSHAAEFEEVDPDERQTRVWTGRSGDAFLVIKYSARSWSKQGAWEHLTKNPPPELLRWPGVSKEDNPYRASHRPGQEYCWLARLPMNCPHCNVPSLDPQAQRFCHACGQPYGSHEMTPPPFDDSGVIESHYTVSEILHVFTEETMRRNGISHFSGGTMINIQTLRGQLSGVVFRLSRSHTSDELIAHYGSPSPVLDDE